MTDASENPFQSPQGCDPKVARWQRAGAASKGEHEILLGSTVASGLRYVMYCFMAISATLGIAFVGLAEMGIYLVGIKTITWAVIAFVIVAATFYFAANYAQVYAPLSLNSYGICGHFAVDRQKIEMEIPWRELVSYELDYQGYLCLQDKDGENYSIFVNWLPHYEREQLLAYCQKQMDRPA
ncbi:hypothetical protein DTL42_10820 [Bremerella cremea]|uniref:YcxB family protein n=1 Tax=Bremerella cremea TaxID=1031537 RepID=A0A368KU54_9BACT|nr:hypothetical protein [Bremerella cremea]RCS50591.1 hypothetical protein DTL42_10820 [Bremerella cremea]